MLLFCFRKVFYVNSMVKNLDIRLHYVELSPHKGGLLGAQTLEGVILANELGKPFLFLYRFVSFVKKPF